MCQENSNATTGEHVPDFSVVGFSGSSSGSGSNRLAEAHAKVPNLHALALSVCVGASYDAATKKICFTIPIYGDLCVTSPVAIPVGGALKVCAQTCGSVIPTGLKVTVYLNGNPAFTTTVFGLC